jgi:hypothetical protein
MSIFIGANLKTILDSFTFKRELQIERVVTMAQPASYLRALHLQKYELKARLSAVSFIILFL